MSRVGKKVIIIPTNVRVLIENEKIKVEGQHGSLEQVILKTFELKKIENELVILRSDDTRQSRSHHGLFRALLQNMVTGVDQKFTKILLAEGIGYKFQLDKNTLILNMGFSHPVQFIIPEELAIKLESPTKICVLGISKEKVGLFASKIRNIRPPEPYKGKGIKYEGEKIIRKAGKTGK